MSVKNKFPGSVADVKLVPKVAYFAPEWVAYFSPEWVAYFAPERWHTIVRIIQSGRLYRAVFLKLLITAEAKCRRAFQSN
ncbi:MAG: hypothetical protein CVT97_08890 [Bacteroidetes bacterium HGW-Bacteroidetes-14]|jgi:hypothetical protein|nr:MAG: hypothetical protein CVU11_16950 [Bacteroidetes bacterium HGW-Bacteroidetes-6]PKP36482.1 MAG: hypothetical protein CVT97_08890 [Bacteroidetes bacterium HGW-Bacteroidetes-14]